MLEGSTHSKPNALRDISLGSKESIAVNGSVGSFVVEDGGDGFGEDGTLSAGGSEISSGGCRISGGTDSHSSSACCTGNRTEDCRTEVSLDIDGAGILLGVDVADTVVREDAVDGAVGIGNG